MDSAERAKRSTRRGNWEGRGLLAKSGPPRMDGIVGDIDRQERKRIQQRLDAAAAERLELT